MTTTTTTTKTKAGAESFAERVGGLRGQHALVGGVRLRLADVNVVVRSNDRAHLEELQAYFGELVSGTEDAAAAKQDPGDAIEIVALEAPSPELDGLDLTIKQPEPGKSSLKEAYVDLPGGRIIRKLKTGVVFFVGDDVHLAVGPCRKSPNQIVNFVNNRFIQVRMREGWLLCHAAAVAKGPRGCVLAGFSGMGKSTLALHMMEHGLEYVSNDRLLVRREVEDDATTLASCGVPKLPRINPGTALSIPRLRSLVPEAKRLRYEAMPTAELWGIEEKYDVDVDSAYGRGLIRLLAPAQTLMILNWSRGAGPCEIREIDLRERPELLAVVMKTAGLFYDEREGALPTEPEPARYLEMLRGFHVVELAGGVDFPAAVAYGLERLGCGGGG